MVCVCALKQYCFKFSEILCSRVRKHMLTLKRTRHWPHKHFACLKNDRPYNSDCLFFHSRPCSAHQLFRFIEEGWLLEIFHIFASQCWLSLLCVVFLYVHPIRLNSTMVHIKWEKSTHYNWHVFVYIVNWIIGIKVLSSVYWCHLEDTRLEHWSLEYQLNG